ncbi:LysR substrate-binding domain-containing protein [Achromobacter anxifer]|jgi:LysR family glycine cleavage system transcriptional activator|uniref:HTH-type transcriptional regulator TrpI n=1 Tax=Achromobacter anxifer TaxID=1287737 RepID=A0A6S7CH35_9BURK|nr:LysR substrate-binding domain-containing protein [Achromobacter anxifer]MDF8360589.1 LysR substrate-binding domain-containing protein [Achromobacter anxifer]CAB3848951.1 HTH-type transcriptional regulator TrpI [Achromobacter anxifer]CAB5513725.1 HTH-type transcriptional regulator TrpI [Achromobacter anxifer]
MRKLPPLASLRAFEAVARTGSVTRAAEELARTHGAVSRHLKLLADDVGLELFERDGTGLRMTPAAADFYAATRSAFDQLERAYENLGNSAAGPGVHVACSATFAMRWLVPQLAVFYRLHPDIRIRLSMTSAREIRNEGADVLVAWDMSHYTEADRRRAIFLAPVNFAAVCVPACARLAPEKQARIAHGYTSSAWDQWEAKTGKPVARGDVLEFPHTHLCIEAALSGLGVALVETRLIARELAEGSLVAPYGSVEFDDGLRALPAAGRRMNGQAEAFLAWLRGALGAR